MKRVSTVETTEVRYVARPMGRERESGPHLADLRAFLAECEGLPDDALVRIEPGQLDESARRNVTLSVTIRRPIEPAAGSAATPPEGSR